MLRRLFCRGMVDTSALFNGHFVEVKSFYFLRFSKVPCVCFVSDIDVTQAFAYIQAMLGSEIVAVYQHGFLDHETGQLYFNNTVVVLRGKRMIELAGNYCHVLHTIRQYAWAHELVLELGANCRLAPKVAEEKRVIGFVRPSEMN